LLTFSDGRPKVHEEMLPINLDFQNRLVNALEGTGEIQVVTGQDIVHTAKQAKAEAERLTQAGVDAVILHFAVWCFPHLATIAANNCRGPFLLLSNLNPNYPGLIAMLASAGCLDQIGVRHRRVWGSASDPKVINKVLQFGRAAHAVNRLRGQTCGLLGGRSMGMYIGAADPRQWQAEFGVDLEHVDQSEIVRIAAEIPDVKVNDAVQWLKRRVGRIVWDDKGLTEEKLRTQVRAYYATKEIVREKDIDFVAIKCQPELSDHMVTQCLSQAFLNDMYDMDGPKEPMVCACEADLDGALTMQILKLITGQPVLFYDLRHYDPVDDTFVFSNCGAMATFYAARSSVPEENLERVTFYPQTPFYYAGGGAAVQFMAASGRATFARLARRDGKYWMVIFTGEFVERPPEKLRETSPEWPQAFVKLDVPAEALIEKLGSNHVHTVPGDHVDCLLEVCSMLGVRAEVLGSPREATCLQGPGSQGSRICDEGGTRT
jgi:L-fucose isomerase